MLNQLQDKPHQCQTELTQHTASLNKLKKIYFGPLLCLDKCLFLLNLLCPNLA